MNDDISLECTRCEKMTRWNRLKDGVVKCKKCGKIHSDDSLVVEWGLIRYKYL